MAHAAQYNKIVLHKQKKAHGSLKQYSELFKSAI